MTATTYTIRLEDQASASAARVQAAMRQVATAAERVASAVQTEDRAYQAVARTAARFAQAELRAARALNAVDRSALKASRSLGGVDKTTSKLTGRFQSLHRGATAVAGFFSAQLVGATFRTGRELLEAAGNAQILERNFARITGDPKELEQTRTLIKALGLDLEAGEKAALKLRTSFGRFTAESLLKTFSALSLGADEVQRASLALSQIQGRGKLQAEELNQFIEAVPGVDRGAIIAQLAKELKITTAEAGERLGKGQIAADVGIRALIFGALDSQKITGNAPGNFAGVDRQVAAGAGDINRQLTALDNTVIELKRSFGAAIASPAVISGIQSLGRALAWVSKLNPTVIRAFALGVGSLAVGFGLLGAAAGYLAIVSVGLTFLTGTLIPATAAAWAFLAPILVAAAPFLAAGAAVAFLGYQIGALVSAWDGELLWSTLKADLGALGTWFAGLATQALEWGKNIVAGLIKGIDFMTGGAVTSIRELGANVIQGAKDIFGIQSPSTVFAEQGRYIDEGLAGGIDDHSDLAFASAESLADGVVAEAEMSAMTGPGVNPTAVANVGAAAGNALAAAPSSGGGATVGPVSVSIQVDGARGPEATVAAIRSFFDTDFAALLERQLEGAGA